MTFFTLHRLLMTFLVIICCVITPYTLAPLPLSHGAPGLTSGKIQVAWRSAALEKSEVAESHSGVRRSALL